MKPNFTHLASLTTALTVAFFPAPSAGFDDETTEENAHSVLKDYPPTSELDFELKVENGVATLTGTVDNLPTKLMASEALATVNGVEAIVNRMQIRQQERDDRSIEFDIERLFTLNGTRDESAIEHKVNDGVVTLTGMVSSFALSNLAQDMAESVTGVRSVTNLLRVRPLASAEDQELRQHLALILESNPWISGELVTATVENGVVVLRGAVDTVSERERLIDAAEIYGITGIDATRLHVSPELRGKAQKAHPTLFRTDEQIKASLDEALRQDPRILSSNIDTEVTDGMVMLSGTVNHLGAKSSAVSIANQLPGAMTTMDFLVVKPENPIPDEELELALQEVINADALLNGADVKVTVLNGKVALTGEVESANQRRRAVEICMFGHGVERVAIKLRVNWDMPEEYAKKDE